MGWMSKLKWWLLILVIRGCQQLHRWWWGEWDSLWQIRRWWQTLSWLFPECLCLFFPHFSFTFTFTFTSIFIFIFTFIFIFIFIFILASVFILPSVFTSIFISPFPILSLFLFVSLFIIHLFNFLFVFAPLFYFDFRFQTHSSLRFSWKTQASLSLWKTLSLLFDRMVGPKHEDLPNSRFGSRSIFFHSR